jgi:hypothetical protein
MDSLLADTEKAGAGDKSSYPDFKGKILPQLERLNTEYIMEHENSSIGNISEEGERILDFDEDSEFTVKVNEMKQRQTDKASGFNSLGSTSRRQSAHARMMSPDVLGQLKSKFGS